MRFKEVKEVKSARICGSQNQRRGGYTQTERDTHTKGAYYRALQSTPLVFRYYLCKCKRKLPKA